MSDRHFPVRPNLDQLKHQAKDMLRALHRGDAALSAEFARNHPRKLEPAAAKLADAQLALARSYGLPSWPRLVLSCRIVDAIWRDDAEMLRKLILKHPRLLHQMARGTQKCNWGPPMSYAANLGRDRIIAMLHELGAVDTQHAFERACLQGQLETARQLLAMGARPARDSVMGPAETHKASGLSFLLDLGAPISDAHGNRLAPVAMVLETYCRNPQGKHQCLDLFAKHGIAFPNTPAMAVHRGRIDLIEEQLRDDPGLFSRTFSHEEIYPPELGCSSDHSLALHGTPISGTTLLHLCVENDEIEIAQWMLERGADVNAKAVSDNEGFGGHTALFGCVVSMPYRAGQRRDDRFARLLLEHGADPKIRASLRKQLQGAPDETMHEYHDVTAFEWGERFHDQGFVNPAVMRLLSG